MVPHAVSSAAVANDATITRRWVLMVTLSMSFVLWWSADQVVATKPVVDVGAGVPDLLAPRREAAFNRRGGQRAAVDIVDPGHAADRIGDQWQHRPPRSTPSRTVDMIRGARLPHTGQPRITTS